MSELSPLGGSEGYGACGDAQMQTFVTQPEPETYCIVGNVIDRQPQNGGNGKGYQADVAYTFRARFFVASRE